MFLDQASLTDRRIKTSSVSEYEQLYFCIYASKTRWSLLDIHLAKFYCLFFTFVLLIFSQLFRGYFVFAWPWFLEFYIYPNTADNLPCYCLTWRQWLYIGNLYSVKSDWLTPMTVYCPHLHQWLCLNWLIFVFYHHKRINPLLIFNIDPLRLVNRTNAPITERVVNPIIPSKLVQRDTLSQAFPYSIFHVPDFSYSLLIKKAWQARNNKVHKQA